MMGQEIKPDVVAHYPYKFLRYFQYRVNLYLESLLGNNQVTSYSDCRRSVLVDMMDGHLELTAGFYRTCNSPIYAIAMLFGNDSTDYLKRYRCLIDEPDSEESVMLLSKFNMPQGKKDKKYLNSFCVLFMMH